ncbi:MAG: M43 family zinc metalloprotease [Flavobacteriales bacterium]|nr:M43 family zinc metalloprotease [Flavobacteriales bacterium]
MTKKLFFALSLVFGFGAMAQHHCPTTDHELEERYKGKPEVLKEIRENQAAFRQMTKNDAFGVRTNDSMNYIPVVFHVLYEEAGDNLSREKILEQLTILNNDIQRKNADKVNTPDYYITPEHESIIEFANPIDDKSNLTGTSRYIVIQGGNEDNAADFDANTPSGDRLVIYFTQDTTYINKPNLTASFGETITYKNIDLSVDSTQAQIKDALMAILSNTMTDEFTYSDASAGLIPAVRIKNKKKGTATHVAVGLTSGTKIYSEAKTQTVGGVIARGAKIQFELAKIDPDGNPTTGINRIYSDRSINKNWKDVNGAIGENIYKNNPKFVTTWDAKKYFNIWVVNSIASSPGGTILGFAQFPSELDFKTHTDGVVIRKDRVGNTFASLGRTLSHEAGHWLGLRHIWGDDDGLQYIPPAYRNQIDLNQDGSISNSEFAATSGTLREIAVDALSAGSDNVEDTPEQGNRTPNICPTGEVAGELGTPHGDMYQNYMDYSNDDCMNLFTDGQTKVMKSSLKAFRKDIWTETNLMATGLSKNFDAATLKPGFNVLFEKTTILEGGNIDMEAEASFVDGSSNYEWTFPGSNLAAKTGQSVNVTFADPGVYSVELKVTNGNGSTTKKYKDVIVVNESSATHAGPLYMTFNNFSSINGGWARTASTNPDDNIKGWSWSGETGKDGSGCVRVTSHKNSGKYVSSLVFKTMDFTNAKIGSANKKLSFDYAYAKRSLVDNDDRLRIMYRASNGDWKILATLSTNPSAYNTVAEEGMVTNGDSLLYNPYWEPTAADWKTYSVNIGSKLNSSKLQLKFEYFGRGGNPFYMDNLTVSNAPLNVEEETLENELTIAPNPTNGNAIIHIQNEELAQDARIEVKDILGKSYGIVSHELNANKNEIALSKVAPSLNNGVYFVTITLGNKVLSKKFVVNK